MKLGINSVLFGGHDMETAFRWTAVCGYDGIELSAIDGMSEHLVIDRWQEVAPEIRKLAGRAKVLINPQNAGERDIGHGDLVRLFNDRGECSLYAEITRDTQPGLLVAEGLHWPRLAPGGKGANQLTSQRFTDQGETCAFHCSLVEVASAYRKQSTIER